MRLPVAVKLIKEAEDEEEDERQYRRKNTLSSLSGRGDESSSIRESCSLYILILFTLWLSNP